MALPQAIRVRTPPTYCPLSESPWQLVAATTAFPAVVFQILELEVLVTLTRINYQRILRRHNLYCYHILFPRLHASRGNADNFIAFTPRHLWEIRQWED